MMANLCVLTAVLGLVASASAGALPRHSPTWVRGGSDDYDLNCEKGESDSSDTTSPHRLCEWPSHGRRRRRGCGRRDQGPRATDHGPQC